MKRKDLLKEIRLRDVDGLKIDDDKMIIEGYPIVFNQETFIGWEDEGFYEMIDPHAFDSADMRDVALKYNHNDNVFILARTRNGSLTLTIDEHGVFMHAELIDTQTNEDVYKMVKSGLLNEGSFSFTVADYKEEKADDGKLRRIITAIGTLFDVAICPNGAYGDLTEIYARSVEAVETASKLKSEDLKKREVLRLKAKAKLKILEVKK